MITGIHHATFLCSDLPRSRAFYEGVLGLRLAENRPQMSFDGVWYDIAQHQQIHLMLLPDPAAGVHRPAHGGRDRHVALGVKNLVQLRARLEAAGVVFTRSQSGRDALFCRDPDGNALEFIEVAW
jgi:catechol 2,3-dioxygenase-like lactoylglutathione lyase family enzyme